jgi:hypothetical protein
MTVAIKNNRIFHYDENGTLKEHFGFSTQFSHFEILKDGRLLVMENYYNYENGENSNLYCINQHIEVEWFAESGKTENGLDNYVEFATNGNKVYATTWNCFRHEIDIETGKILSSVFTK